MYVLEEMETRTDVDAIGKTQGNDAERLSPASHRSSDGVTMYDGAVLAVACGDSLTTETPASSRKCGIAKWSERIKASSRNDATHNLRTRVNR